MIYAIIFILALATGAGSVLVLMLEKFRRVRIQGQKQDALARQLRDAGKELKRDKGELEDRRQEFEKRVIRYDELNDENLLLKCDLQNIDVNLRKLQLDVDRQNEARDNIANQVNRLGEIYLKENVKWIGKTITPNNLSGSKKRLQDVIGRCRGIGYAVSQEEESLLHKDLKTEFERSVKAAFEREEQSRIKAQIREEQKLEREIERELEQVDRQRKAIETALKKALAEAQGEHGEEIEQLKVRLKEAEEASERTKSRAQMTKSGYVYVISNVGSFGEGVFKVGLTRRLEPMDRVRELGDASVPFPFDVHMMINSNDAPSLENALHHALHRKRLNKANHRKEFFRVDIESLRRAVIENHGEVEYVADAEALQYRESLSMSDDDAEYLEAVYERLEGDVDRIVTEE